MHSTDNLDDDYLGSGKYLRRSLNKHGVENHTKEILEYLPNRSSLKERERELVNEKLILDKFCMNLQPGGGGGFCNEEHRKKCILAWRTAGIKKLIWLAFNDLKWKEEHSQKIKKVLQNEEIREKIRIGAAKSFKGKHHTEEFKIKLGLINSIKQKGEKNSQYGTCWITNNKENKKIKNEEILDYLNQGWSKGRKIKF
jgi:hypothetical protein